MAETLKLCGPSILTPGAQSTTSTPLEQATAALILVLQKQHPCQKDEDDLDDEPDSEAIEAESAEYDWLVIETALEVIAGLAAALGQQFGELWKIFETPIMKYASSQERFERSSAVGTIADCVQGMKGGCTPYTQRMMRVLLKRLGDEDAEVKSNAAFGAGLLCEMSGDEREVTSNYGSLLRKLEPLLDASTSNSSKSSDDASARLLDNAAGCVARMIRAHPQQVPLDEVLPRLVEILPLKQDYDENEPVFEMIVSLYQQNNTVVQGLTGQLIPVLEQVLGEPNEQLKDELRGKVEQLYQYLKK